MTNRFFQSKLVQRIVRINDTPQAIALGAAVGIFIGMTPTVGIQMVLMVIVGTVIRANRLAGVAMVYVSNPFTILPIYWLDYWVGSLLLRFESITYDQFEDTCNLFMEELHTAGLLTATSFFVQSHSDIAWSLIAGGVVLGIVFAIPVYPLTLQIIWAHRRHKAKSRAEAKAAAGEDRADAPPP